MIETHIVIAQRVKEFADKLQRGIDYIEVGVNRGASALAVLETEACRHATLIDNWCYESACKETTEKLLAPYAAKVRIISGDSKMVIKFVVGMFDIGYVDGDHTEEGCITDMTNMLPMIRETGVLFVDDLNNPSCSHLNSVVNKFVKKNKLHMQFHDSHCGLAEIWKYD